MRLTIDFGIDLGTTNSAIARQVGASPQLLLNGDGDPLLPSAIYIDAKANMTVGRAALDHLIEDPANTAREFKRSMGSASRIAFPASGKSFSPEELSAEILRTLVRRAEAVEGEPIRAAVITVPAMFQLPQCEATRKAAGLAGLEQAPLLQEPIAAAMAYAGTGRVQDGYWLVYDLGGGTFDVSLVRSRSGRLQVLDHDGDNHLGGKDLNRVLARRAAEQVRADGRLGAFSRTDPAFADAFARLMFVADKVRIELSAVEQTDFAVDRLAQAADGQWVGLRMPIDRGTLAELLRPTFSRTVELCKKLISRNQLSARELQGIVLVGGPTRTPFLPPLLTAELGVPAGHVADPTTIVAAGAALFASTQKLNPALRTRGPRAAEEVELQLEYESMTTNPRPPVVVKSEAFGSGGPWELRIKSDGTFDSGRIRLGPQPVFSLALPLERNRLNAFEIETWASGQSRLASPSRFTILHGASIGKPPLSQSVGVILADNSACWYLRKGEPLPARKTVTHVTTQALRRGQSGDAIHVPLVQGENERADRNKVIGVLRIRAEALTRDLPAGSAVEVTLTVDEFSNTTARAFVPALQTWFDDVASFQMETKQAAEVERGLSAQQDRLAELDQMAQQLSTDSAPIDGQLKQIEELIAEGDSDSTELADQLLRLATAEIDEAEQRVNHRKLVSEFDEIYQSAREIIEKHGQPSERQELEALAREYREAMASEDLVVASAKRNRVEELKMTVWRRTSEFWVMLLRWVVGQLERLNLLAMAKSDVEEAQAAVNRDDRGGMMKAFGKLFERLPREEKTAAPAQVVMITSQIT